MGHRRLWLAPSLSKETCDWLRAGLTRFVALRLSRNSHPQTIQLYDNNTLPATASFLPCHQPLSPSTIRKLCQLIRGPHLTDIWQNKHLAERVLVAFEWPCGRIQRLYTGQISIAMAPRSRLNGNDTDMSMADAPEPDHRPGEDMVCCSFREETTRDQFLPPMIMLTFAQDVDETPDYTDSDTNPNTTASSVAGDLPPDGRKRRSEANQLRRSIFGKKHDRLGESKVQFTPIIQAWQSTKSPLTGR